MLEVFWLQIWKVERRVLEEELEKMLENIINKTVGTNRLLYFLKLSLGSEEVPEEEGVVIDL
jgi:hypothetical protein